MTLKAVFFDHDGTLVNSEVEHCRFWQIVMQQQGVDLSTKMYMDLYCGVPGAENAEMLVEQYDLAISSAQLLQAKEVVTQAYLDQQPYPLISGVRDILDWCQQKKLTLAVVSGAIETRVLSSLNGHQITPYFKFICCADEVAQNKPDPAIYKLALEKSGFQADECLAIEDTNVGVQSVIEAGLTCCAIRHEYAPDHDLSMASVIVHNMAEARQWINANYF